MNSLKILIVEGGKMTVKDVRESLEEIGHEVVDIVSSEKAIEVYQKELPELLLVDSNLKDCQDGMRLIKGIYEIKPVPFIYLAVPSDKSRMKSNLSGHSSGYLTKHMDNKDMKDAIELAISNFSDRKKTKDPAPKPNSISGEFLFFKIGKTLKKVPMDSILYAKANGSYTDLITTNDRLTLAFNLHHFLEKSVKLDLIRVHRSYAVNINQLNGYSNHKLQIGNVEIPVSRTFRAALKEIINVL